MNQTSMFFKLSFKFISRYFQEFFLALIKPLLFTILGSIFVFLCYVSPFFVIFAILVSIPVCCWACWKIYVIFYALIPASYEFIKNGARKPFKTIVENINQKELAAFALFYCVVSMLLFLPYISFALTNLYKNTGNPENIIFSIIFTFLLLMINVILASPFLNFALQALYFKKPRETFIDVFKNCYSYINKEGCVIIIAFIVIQGFVGMIPFAPLVSVFLLPPLFSSVGTFWYLSRLKQKL